MGLIGELSALYRLDMEKPLTPEGWKEKPAGNFLESIETSKRVPFGRVLFA